MVVQGLTRRLSKLEGAKELEVSPTTIDRMIARGEIQTEQEARGSRYKVWVLLPEDEHGSSGDPPDGQSGGEQLSATDKSEVEELIRLRLQVKNLEDLSNYRSELLNQAGQREQLLMDQLTASQKNLASVTLALNPGHAPMERPRRSWWPWRRSAVKQPRKCDNPPTANPTPQARVSGGCVKTVPQAETYKHEGSK